MFGDHARGRCASCWRRRSPNELTRGGALRFGALLHDIAKPQTRAVTAEGRVTFMGHDEAGAQTVGGDPRRGCGPARGWPSTWPP